MKTLVIVITGLLLTSCAGVTTVSRPTQTFQTEHVKKQNYEVGRRQTAYVGESMVSVKDFLVSQSNVTHMRPDKQFALSKWLDEIHGAPGTDFKIAGQTGSKVNSSLSSMRGPQWAAITDCW